MKILVFSDTHLGKKFNQKKFDFLKRIIIQADKVIINGDFWEGYKTSFSQFMNSSWQALFPLLKEKGAIYIFGNHDKKYFADDRLHLFSTLQTNQYRLKMNGHIYIVEHGHRLVSIDKVISNIGNRIKLQKTPKIITESLDLLEFTILKIIGKNFFKLISRRLNQKMKLRIKKKRKEKEIFICGHTHSSEIDLENHFANSGFIKHGLGQYLILDTDTNQIEVKEEWYN